MKKPNYLRSGKWPIQLAKYSLVILPVVFVMLAILIHFSYGKFYMSCTDPEYFHLFNGLNISIFNLAVDYITHPGTTIQMIYAWSARIVNLIEPSGDLIKNAMDNPEDFIHGANILLNLLTGMSLFALGWFTYKYTKNIFLALLLQLMPFSNYKLLLISGRLLPETALIAPIILLVSLVIIYLYDDAREKRQKRYIFGFAIIGGLGIAGKLSYLPFLLVPLFLLPGAKTKGKYILYTFIAIVFFAFPMFTHIGKSFEWFGGMFLHSGKWGSGSADIINTTAIPDRLTELFEMDKFLFILSGLAFIQLAIFYFLPAARRRPKTDLLLRILVGFLIAFAISVLLVVKHFASHYFIPFLALKIVFLFLMAELILINLNSKKIKLLISGFVLLLVLISGISQVNTLKNRVGHLAERGRYLEQREYVLQQYNVKSNPLIIASHYRGSPYVQSALVNGCLMSGFLKSTFIHILAKKYPNTYFYFDWTDQFYLWDKFYKTRNIVDTNKPLYVFIGEGQESKFPLILDRIKNDLPDYNPEIKILQRFSDPEEVFYEIRFTKKEKQKDLS